MAVHRTDVLSTGPSDPSDLSETGLRVPSGVAATIAPLVHGIYRGEPPVRIEFWDGSCLGRDTSVGVAHVRSERALRHLVWAPGELGLGRAFVTGDLDVSGDLVAVLGRLEHAAATHRLGGRQLAAAVIAARRLGALGPPPPAPPEEVRVRGRRHTPRRDAAAVRHHYDVGNDFYQLLLGRSLTYSCARFVDERTSLDRAQSAKHELVCRKLGLHEQRGRRLLDVGCGWGSMAIHAARHHGARVVGVSISSEQVELARQRVSGAGLGDLVEIRLQDYRELRGEQFDAISSVGMFEHVGSAQMARYFEVLRRALAPTGRLLNHAISSVGGSRLGPRSFVGRYVFPDGELIDVGQVVSAMQRAGFEVRDVESLREHYARTLREWIRNLEQSWGRAVELVGERRARVWRLYMAASAVGFDDGGISVHQTLGVLPAADGRSGMPPTRREYA